MLSQLAPSSLFFLCLFHSPFSVPFHISPSSLYILYIYICCVIHSDLQWVMMDGGGGVIFSRIIIQSSVSPLILPTDPNFFISTPVLFYFPSLLSALLNQGALTIAPEWQFFTLILRPVVMEIGLSKQRRSTPHTWNMNDEIEFLCICLFVFVCECVRTRLWGGAGGFQHLITILLISSKEENGCNRRRKRCVKWKQEVENLPSEGLHSVDSLTGRVSLPNCFGLKSAQSTQKN